MPSQADYERFFRKADVNGDGSLTLDELSTVLRNSGYRGSDSELKAQFQEVDTSGDGSISYQEYMVAMGQMPAEVHGSAAMRRCFLSFDKNGDGHIDRSEMASAMGEMGKTFTPKEIERMVYILDKDNSGTIDYEEFIKFFFGK